MTDDEKKLLQTQALCDMINIYNNFVMDIFATVMDLCTEQNAKGMIIGEAMQKVIEAKQEFKSKMGK